MFREDVLRSIRDFEVMDYLRSPWNWIDWAHFSLMGVGWLLWLSQTHMGASFEMPDEFNVLVSLGQETQARMFLTDAKAEFDFLQFVSKVKAMRENLAMYSFLTSICGESAMG
jgi:hypothetical protein